MGRNGDEVFFSLFSSLLFFSLLLSLSLSSLSFSFCLLMGRDGASSIFHIDMDFSIFRIHLLSFSLSFFSHLSLSLSLSLSFSSSREDGNPGVSGNGSWKKEVEMGMKRKVNPEEETRQKRKVHGGV